MAAARSAEVNLKVVGAAIAQAKQRLTAHVDAAVDSVADQRAFGDWKPGTARLAAAVAKRV